MVEESSGKSPDAWVAEVIEKSVAA